MAIASVIRVFGETVFFRMSNKPEFVCQCDILDFNLYLQGSRSWYIHVSNSKKAYIRRGIYPTFKNEHFHRVVKCLGDFSMQETVDHLNGNGLDNRKANLEIVTQAENTRRGSLNRGKHKGTKYYRGVALTKTRGGKYTQAYSSQRGKSTYIGCCKDLEKLKKKIDNYLDEVKEV